MMKRVAAIAFRGAEDIELTVTVDILRRAGFNVVVANLDNESVFQCARDTKVQADALFNDIKEETFDAVFVPGGGGVAKIAEDEARLRLLDGILTRHHEAGKIVSAICAAPYLLALNGISKGCKITSYPSMKQKIVDLGYHYLEDRVVVDKNIVTSRGPGTAFAFALKLVELLDSKEKADKLTSDLLYQGH